jgi:hypothetical protein
MKHLDFDLLLVRDQGIREGTLILAGLPTFSLTVSYRFYRCQRIRTDVAKFYAGQIRAKMCNLRRMRGVENPSNKIPLPAP